MPLNRDEEHRHTCAAVLRPGWCPAGGGYAPAVPEDPGRCSRAR